MAKYVKVDGMKLDYSRLVYIPPNDGLAIAKFFADQISNLPAADVTPVVRGEWVDTPNGTEIICSYCKADWNVFDNDTYRFNYCPNCGAKMEREDEDTQCPNKAHI